MTEQKPPTWLKAFASLRHRNYRLLWSGTLISHSGDWLDQIALNWLVLELTGSVFYLGLVNLCRGLPILLCTLIGGAVADRMERRRLMFFTQGSAMVLATLLAVMVLTGHAPLWAIMLIATARGIVVAFNLPARQSLISDLVPRGDLPNALALNSMTINLTKIVGPMLAGLIIAAFGTGVCFAINAVSFIAVLGTLLAMRFPGREPRRAPPESFFGSIVSGLRFVAGEQTILLLVLVAIVPMFFGQPFVTLLAIWAYEVFQTGPEGLGVLTASAAGGSVIGGLVMANFGHTLTRGWVMLLLLSSYGAGLAIFALNPSPQVAPLILVAVGASMISYNIAHSSLLQMIVPDAFRGRVLSTLFLNRGLLSMGTATWATIAALGGPRLAFGLMGVSIIVFAVGLVLFAPRLRSLRT